jgi:hypothetical protein
LPVHRLQFPAGFVRDNFYGNAVGVVTTMVPKAGCQSSSRRNSPARI